LASDADHVLLSLSGGLDSSIVAAALAASGKPFTCLTLATADRAGDERVYAREISRHLSVELLEEFERLDLIDIYANEARHLPRPVSRSFAQSADKIHQQAATQIGADLFMTGGGGDNVFCFLHSAAPIADRLLTPAARFGALQTLREVATMTGVGMGRALRGALSKVRCRDAPHQWPKRMAFLTQTLKQQQALAAATKICTSGECDACRLVGCDSKPP
jgi:asparagine synthase (glutamine-hydrolysing)